MFKHPFAAGATRLSLKAAQIFELVPPSSLLLALKGKHLVPPAVTVPSRVNMIWMLFFKLNSLSA